MDKKWWTLGAVCFGTFMLLLDVTIVYVALPQIERTFHATISDLQWVLDAYALTLAALLLTAGSLADRIGRRTVFATGLVVFTIGSLLCGLSTSALFLILARAFQGIGGAILFATSLALIANAFQGRERGVAFSAYGAVAGSAAALGPVVGGAITSAISWRWIFIVNVPIGVLALAVTLLLVEESRAPSGGRVDVLGFATFSVALAALVFGLIESGRDGWGASIVPVALSVSFVLFATFIVAERRQRHPMFDLSLLRLPTFAGGLVAAFAVNGGLFALFTYLVLYLQNLLGLSAIATGVRFLLLTGALFVTAGIAGRLTNVVPIKWLMAAGFLLVGVGLLLMDGVTVASTWAHLAAGLAVAGAGAGLINVPLASTAVGVVEPARAGMASGINSTFRQVGTATGIAALGTVFTGKVRSIVIGRLEESPLRVSAHEIAQRISAGASSSADPSSPTAKAIHAAAASGVVAGLNELFIIGAVVSFIACALSLVLIRQRDFQPDASGHMSAG